MKANRTRDTRREALRLSLRRACVICGVMFTPRQASYTTITCSKTCSRKHGQAHNREMYARKSEEKRRPCVICSVPFVPKSSSFTCSIACRRKYKKEWNRQYHKDKNLPTCRTMRACKVCEAAFSSRDRQNIYCSRACSQSVMVVRLRERRAKNPDAFRLRDRLWRNKTLVTRRRQCREHYAKHPDYYRDRYQSKMLAYKALKELEAAPDHLPTWGQRLEFSHKVIKQLETGEEKR